MTEDPPCIGRYVVDTVLGRGAMGVVYRAHDPAIDRVVAIKLIRADLLEGEEQTAFIGRFRQEARAAGRCSHPNIVAIYDFAVHEGNPFLAMELVEGADLRKALAANLPPSAQDVTSVGRQILAALGAAHAAGIVHRDIKPANILMTKAGQVKVSDFGISQIQSTGFTQTGTVLGTPSYMSPEQWRGDSIDRRSDLFSLGVVLYELLAGKLPFAGKIQHEVMYRVLNEAPEDLRKIRPDIPIELSRAIMKALAKAPDERFSLSSDMAEALILSGQSASSHNDDTLVVPWKLPVGTGDMPAFDPELIQSLERRLAQFVGPIAGRLMQSAIRSSDDLAGLCASLASQIKDPTDRGMFRVAAERQLGQGHSQSSMIAPTSSISPAELERVRHELAVFTGPLARVLVKKAAPKASSPAALWRDLAEHIPNPSDRTAFLAKAPAAP